MPPSLALDRLTRAGERNVRTIPGPPRPLVAPLAGLARELRGTRAFDVHYPDVETADAIALKGDRHAVRGESQIPVDSSLAPP